MFKRLLFILHLALIAILFSCKTYKPVAFTSASGVSAKDYIDRYSGLAISEMKRTGIPASITLAQGMIESDYGRSRLAREANNHFGIKCHNDWTGPTIRHNDDKRNECFRKYRKPEESFYDHSDFLKSGSRYNFLFDINPTDYKGWARGLKKAGYATNPDYANMLIRKIEEENLWYFDRGINAYSKPEQIKTPIKESVLVTDTGSNRNEVPIFNGDASVVARVPRVMENNRIKYILVKDGDSREKLEKEFQLLKWELPRYNELDSEFSMIPGQILYLQPKREKAEPGNDYYRTIEGDTMYNICQKFGIKLKSLYEMNRMEEGTEPVPGTKLWLRSLKPVR